MFLIYENHSNDSFFILSSLLLFLSFIVFCVMLSRSLFTLGFEHVWVLWHHHIFHKCFKWIWWSWNRYKKNTLSWMSIWTVELWTFFFKSTGLMNVKAVVTISTVGEKLALNMLKTLKSQIEWVSLFFFNFAFGNVGLFFSNFNLIFLF